FLLGSCLLLMWACASALRSNPIEAKTDPFWEGRAQQLLLGFEDSELPASLRPFSAELSLLNKVGTTEGKQALQLAMKGDEKAAGVEFKPETPIDASEFERFCLVFDATNLGAAHSVHLFVNVVNEKGHRLTRSVAIPVGETRTCFFELAGQYVGEETGLREDPAPWNTASTHMKINGTKQDIDYSRIASIKFYLQYTIADKALALDNIRLVESPEKDADYLTGLVDKFGQNAKVDFPGKITSEEQLKRLAEEELAELVEQPVMPDRGTYGGWKSGPQLEATGYFRTQKMGKKWALVDPEGYLFFSTGIANVRMANTTSFTGIDFKEESVRYRDPEDVTPEDSRGMVALSEAVTSTAYEAYPWRRKMFTELPAYDDSLANHFSYRREQHMGPFAHGETFSFYQANLERRYGEPSPGAHLEKWVDVTLDRFLSWGFTSFGNWVAVEFYEEERMPYFANGWIIGDFKTVRSGLDYWGPMPDVFDPEFARRVDVTVKVVAEEVKNSPWCIGVFIDNEKSWGVPGTPKGQYGIVLDALSMPTTESPVKAEFLRMLKEKYATVAELNAAWETEITSWSSLETGINYKEKGDYAAGMVADFSVLLEAYASRYFELVHDALARELPNHLYMGCRFASWGMGPEVRKAAKKYVDVFSYNFYHEGIGEKYWQFLIEMDRPSIIGEYHIGTLEAGLFHPGLVHASNQEDRAKMYLDYMNSVIDNPYFVGAHWFQYIDSPISGRAHDGENYNVGFVTNADVPYAPMVKAARELNRKLYPKRYGER
ncbi:MAG: agarase, partial [Bacteroidota bacterium]